MTSKPSSHGAMRLSPDELQRVHGATWSEKCADAARLAELREPRSVRERALRHLQEMQDEARS